MSTRAETFVSTCVNVEIFSSRCRLSYFSVFMKPMRNLEDPIVILIIIDTRRLKIERISRILTNKAWRVVIVVMIVMHV